MREKNRKVVLRRKVNMAHKLRIQFSQLEYLIIWVSWGAFWHFWKFNRNWISRWLVGRGQEGLNSFGKVYFKVYIFSWIFFWKKLLVHSLCKDHEIFLLEPVQQVWGGKHFIVLDLSHNLSVCVFYAENYLTLMANGS